MKYSRVVRSSWVVLLMALYAFFGSEASVAQLNWHATLRAPRTPWVGLGCAGNSITACLPGVEDSTGDQLTFYRSDDAGMTWTPQHLFVPKDQLKPTPPGFYGRGVAIDQIDSAHAIIAITGGTILSTTDAGNTWTNEPCPVNAAIGPFSCANFGEGIAVATDTPAILLRGAHEWVRLPFTTSVRLPNDTITWRRDDFWSSFMGGQLWCHAYGEGKFRVVAQGVYSSATKRTQMELYTTTDNWKSVDSISIPFWSIDSGYHVDWDPYVCFGGADSISVFGESWLPNRYIIHRDNMTIDTVCDHSYGIVAHSTDGGRSWERSIDTSNRHGFYGGASTGRLLMLGTIDSTAIYPSHHEIELVSHDAGFTWELDSMRFDDPSDAGAFLESLVTTADGSVIGSFYHGSSSFIAKLSAPNASVELAQSVEQESVYPNPASSTIYISKLKNDAKVFDNLGREYDTPIAAQNTLDISHLLPGVYYIGNGEHRARFVKE
jgi:hypothetical protein